VLSLQWAARVAAQDKPLPRPGGAGWGLAEGLRAGVGGAP